jgi:hypothetical protein
MPPKDAQLLEGSHQRYEHQLTEKGKLEGKMSKSTIYDYLVINPQHKDKLA